MPTTSNRHAIEAKDLVRNLAHLAAQRSTESEKVFLQEMNSEYWTHQESISLMMLQWFAHLASLSEDHFDARNEDAVRAAKAMMPALEQANIAWQGPDGAWRVHLRYI